MGSGASPVRLEAWSERDFDLLRAVNAPELMAHLGGPETAEQLVKRHQRYVDLSADRSGAGRMFRIVLEPEGVPVGVIGFWEQTWDGTRVYETGWTVLGGFQGRGVATAATVAVADRARAARKHRYLHAFPSVDNGPSNAVCRKAGFELLGERDFEYPPGHLLRSNNWRLDLEAGDPGSR
ncbi:GCN5 family acetyltransferase [Streptomyces sp. CB03234]|uniref:GNAT family N-acetyltransferase n=1 Tax=Streptomyces sp. (strain CB03234) TaxID=1703937 RepID=UPI00093BF204|nr:GNAT family protein [Streptomyces sp. CB03234]OKK05822.1 GCN5 family acetyltransferase [Streptomyces sp. CB03234]